MIVGTCTAAGRVNDEHSAAVVRMCDEAAVAVAVRDVGDGGMVGAAERSI